MHMSFDMKFLVKVTINTLNLLVVIKTKKKKKKLYHFSRIYWHLGLEGHYIWYQSKRLKRSDLMDSSTCRYVVNYVI